MKLAGYAQNQESVFTAMIRCCSNNLKPNEAYAIYKQMQELNLIPKLRTFSPLLAIYSTLKEEGINVCFELFDELLNRYSLTPTEKEYTSLLKVCIATNDKRFYWVRFGFLCFVGS